MINECKFLLVQIITPDAIIRLKRSETSKEEFDHIAKLYTQEQHHTSLTDFLAHQIRNSDSNQGCRMQVSQSM